MRYEPHAYQDDITDRILNNPNLAIWAGMGMGKTAATLTAISCLQMVDPMPALVLAPKLPASVTWPDEIKKWDHLKHLRCSIIVGTAAERQAALRREADIYCMNYDNLPWLLEQLKKWPFKIVVADESTRLKSFRHRGGGKRAYALARVKANKHIDRFIALTGTPAPNGVIDLWGQQWFIDMGRRLGQTFTDFRNRWFTPRNSGLGFMLWDPHPRALGEIRELVKDTCFSYEAEDYFDIEKPISIPLYVDLPPAARRIYDGMEKDFYSEIAGTDFEAANAGVKSVKCLQIAGGAIYNNEDEGHYRSWQHIHDAKIDMLHSVVEEAAGEPLLVAFQFNHEMERILKAFPQAQLLTHKAIPEWNRGRSR
jgi:hypothetical protein